VSALGDLSGKVAIVTGADRAGDLFQRWKGAPGQHDRGAALRQPLGDSPADPAPGAIGAAGGTALAHPADVAREADVLALRDAALARFGRIDALVNNAGINPIWRGIEKISASDWQAIVDVNLTGVFLCCKHIGGAMAERGAGSIINVTSVAGHVGLVRSVPYCATKGGVEMLSKALALDWAKRGVRVNCLAPGYVDTDLTAGLLHHETLSKPFLEHTPMGRFGTADEVAGLVAFLCSRQASYITGASIDIAGGMGKYL